MLLFHDYFVDANIIFGVSLFVLQMFYFFTSDKSWKPIKLLYAVLIGLYWAAVWFYVHNASSEVWESKEFGTMFVKGGITLTLITLNFGAVYRLIYHIKYHRELSK